MVGDIITPAYFSGAADSKDVSVYVVLSDFWDSVFRI